MAFRSDLLFQFLRDRANDLAEVNIDDRPPVPFPHADPWLLSSAMQKAIRRGDITIARRAGHHLYALDRARLWRRLSVIALEDIGIANIEVAAEMIAISTVPTARRLLGGDLHALDIALARACMADKDRSGDHLGSIVNREPIDDADRAILRTASPNALIAIIASSDLPWTRRLRASVVASGRTDEAVHTVARDIVAVLDLLHDLGVPSLLIAVCESYAARQRDALPVFVPFAWLLNSTACTANSACEPHIVVHDAIRHELIGELPAYAFDPVNTRLGRRAVDLWLRAYWTKPPWLPRQVAAALWNSESALCDRTLSWPLGNSIRERAYRADLLARGLPIERHAELMAWVTRERPALTAARTAVWNSVRRDAGKTGEGFFQPNLPLQVRPTKNRNA